MPMPSTVNAAPESGIRPLAFLPDHLDARIYAIAFDMDIEALRLHYGDPYNNAYVEIRKILQSHGFTWQQGSVYFGGERINAVTCVLAAVDLSRKLSWFAHRFATFACCESKN